MFAKVLRKNLALVYMLILTLLLEWVFQNYLGIFGINSDVFLILIVFLTLYSFERISFFVAVSLGALRDIFGISSLGFYILGFLLCRFVIEKIKKKIYPGRIIVDTFLIFISSIVLYLYLSLIASLKHSPFLFKEIPLTLIIGSAVYTALISLPLFLIFKKIRSTKERR